MGNEAPMKVQRQFGIGQGDVAVVDHAALDEPVHSHREQRNDTQPCACPAVEQLTGGLPVLGVR